MAAGLADESTEESPATVVAETRRGDPISLKRGPFGIEIVVNGGTAFAGERFTSTAAAQNAIAVWLIGQARSSDAYMLNKE